jgi:hypothetical protein
MCIERQLLSGPGFPRFFAWKRVHETGTRDEVCAKHKFSEIACQQIGASKEVFLHLGVNSLAILLAKSLLFH